MVLEGAGGLNQIISEQMDEITRLEAENIELKERYDRLVIGFESLRQSLTQMQPDYERCKSSLADAIRLGNDMADILHAVCVPKPSRTEEAWRDRFVKKGE